MKNQVVEFIRAAQKRAPSTARQETPSGSLATYIDHTLLKADATQEDVRRLCAEARTHGFATVCLNSVFIPLAARLLEGAASRPIAVVGFPLGAGATVAKAFETRGAIQDGAAEIDMVIALGALKAGDFETVHADIRAVAEAAQGRPVKVILETCLLDEEQKLAGCYLAARAGAAFVKTSTGFSTGGATEADIRLMRLAVGPETEFGLGIKASGGIRTRGDALRMLAAGATRLGASASVAIVTNAAGSAGGY